MPVWTTLLGFSLGLAPGLIARLRDKWQAGELFKTELATLKICLEEQVIEIRRYKNEFLNPPMQTAKLNGLTLVLLHKFEIIKTFNKITLIKYSKKEYGDEAPQYISSLYQMFGVIERDIKRLEKNYTDYQIEFDNIGTAYITEINNLRSEVIMIRDQLGDKAKEDVFIMKLWEVAFSAKPDMTTYDIINFGRELHPKLLKEKIFTNTKHLMYKSVLNFVVTGTALVNRYDNKKAKFTGLLDISEETFGEALKELSQ